jgi:hypothetical protein
VVVAFLLVAAGAAPRASAVLARLKTGGALSFQPVPGTPRANALRRVDEAFGNVDYNGGPIMPSNTNYTLYWDPSGAPSPYPSGYQSGIDTFFADLAHDSGHDGNVDSVAAQYNDTAGQAAAYDSHFGGSLSDADPYPLSGCLWAPVCLTEEQISEELVAYIDAHSLPTGLGTEYFVVTPPGVESCFTEVDGKEQCSPGAVEHAAYCAYHEITPGSGGQVVFAVQPFVNGTGCDNGEHPNNSPSDGAIQGGLSHEHNESITDPEPNDAWADADGNGAEIGDKCEQHFGSSLGTAVDGAKYNQVINGHLYLYQEEWSNQGSSCLQRLTSPEPRPQASFGYRQTGPLTVAFDASSSSAVGGVHAYDWQFDDDQAPRTPEATSETGFPAIEHTFPGPGIYEVALTVFGPDGVSSGAAETVVVEELPQPAPGWELQEFAVSFPSTYLGPIGIVSDASSNFYVDDAPDGLLYRFGPSGGVAGEATAVSSQPFGEWPLGLAFGKDGELYAALPYEGLVVELDPATGRVLRDVASVGLPLGIATDPLTGDLFVTSDAAGGVYRISDPAGAQPGVSLYAGGMSGPDGISAGPDGTFYVEDAGTIEKIGATDSDEPGGVVPFGYVAGADGIAIGANPFNPAAPSNVVVNDNYGQLTKLGLDGLHEAEQIFYGGTRGDFVTVAPDGCLYATQISSVVRVSGEHGACPFSPISPFQPPGATPLPPGPLTSFSAVLQAVVNPHGAATTFHFEYGPTVAYGAETPEASAGASEGPVAVSQTVAGLSPSTEYHYRVVGHNQAGTIIGPDSVLVTEAAPTSQSVGPPTNRALPTVSGRAVAGGTLTCSSGSWAGATGFSFTWVRDGHVTVGGSSTYRVTVADTGHRLACRVLASGPGGATPVLSAVVTVTRVTSVFSLLLRARRASTAFLASHGAQVLIGVPRACTVTLRVAVLRKQGRRRSVHPVVVETERIVFRKAGHKLVHVSLGSAGARMLRAGAIVRIGAIARAGAAVSRPASVALRS